MSSTDLLEFFSSRECPPLSPKSKPQHIHSKNQHSFANHQNKTHGQRSNNINNVFNFHNETNMKIMIEKTQTSNDSADFHNDTDGKLSTQNAQKNNTNASGVRRKKKYASTRYTSDTDEENNADDNSFDKQATFLQHDIFAKSSLGGITSVAEKLHELSDDEIPPNVTWVADPGAAYRDSAAINFDNSAFVVKQLLMRRNEYTQSKHIKVWCGTYNVNAKKIPSEYDISDWIWCRNDKRKAADIYAIGFQEIVDLNASSLLIDHSASRPWEVKILDTLNSGRKHHFEVIAECHLVGLALLIFAKKSLLPFISDVRTTTVGVGIMGIGGNKGATVVRFDFYNSSLCFVNTHLAAHQNHVKARNSDYHSICKRAALLPVSSDSYQSEYDDVVFSTIQGAVGFIGSKINKLAKDVRERHFNKGEKNMLSKDKDFERDGYGIFDHDHVFWIGDNNYRIAGLGIEQVHNMIEENKIHELVMHDQLTQEKSKGNAFAEFQEGEITFPPTYKYITGTNRYDRKEGGKMRIPAYCDRIQWLGGRGIIQKLYASANLTLSDHKPVLALFSVPIQIEIAEKRKAIEDFLLKLSPEDAWPQLVLSTRIIELDDVFFERPIIKKLYLRNVGKSVVSFSCMHCRYHTVDENGEQSSTQDASSIKPSTRLPPWLKVLPSFGVLDVGASAVIELHVRVNRMAACVLNCQGDKSLLSLLLLKVEDGGCYSIGIRGNYNRTILGSPLDWLNRLPGPIRTTQAAIVRDSPICRSYPAELTRLLEYLARNGVFGQPQLFRFDHSVLEDWGAVQEDNEGIQFCTDPQITSIFDCLDKGQSFGNPSLHIILRVVRIFLLCLPTPLLARSPMHSNQLLPLSEEHKQRQDRLRSLVEVNESNSFEISNEVSSDGESDTYSSFNNDGNSDQTSNNISADPVERWCIQLLYDMPTDQYHCLMYVLAFLRSALKASFERSLDYISESFSPCLTFCPAGAPIAMYSTILARDVVRFAVSSSKFK